MYKDRSVIFRRKPIRPDKGKEDVGETQFSQLNQPDNKMCFLSSLGWPVFRHKRRKNQKIERFRYRERQKEVGCDSRLTLFSIYANHNHL